MKINAVITTELVSITLGGIDMIALEYRGEWVFLTNEILENAIHLPAEEATQLNQVLFKRFQPLYTEKIKGVKYD